MYKLYFKNKFISEHEDFQYALAQARWHYFNTNNKAWVKFEGPPGFFILYVNLEKIAAESNPIQFASK